MYYERNLKTNIGDSVPVYSRRKQYDNDYCTTTIYGGNVNVNIEVSVPEIEFRRKKKCRKRKNKPISPFVKAY